MCVARLIRVAQNSPGGTYRSIVMLKKALVAACLSVAFSISVLGDPASPPVPAIDRQPDGVQLETLAAVQDVRSGTRAGARPCSTPRRRLKTRRLRGQLGERLTRLAPQVAKSLMSAPGESAVVTVAVYRAADSGAQESAAAAFEGREGELDPGFFRAVLADLPGPHQGVGQALALDRQSSSYLIFFLDNGDLKAGVVPHDRMKESLGDALVEHASQPQPRPTQPPRRRLLPVVKPIRNGIPQPRRKRWKIASAPPGTRSSGDPPTPWQMT